jgi:hypothetical protein
MGIRHEPEGAQMTRRTANPDLTTSHYTRRMGTGEAPGRGAGVTRARPAAQPQPKSKEITMLRIRTTTAMLALAISSLTLSAAQAGTDTLASQIHDAAVTACAPEHASGMLPRAHYGAIDEHCVYRISRSATAKYEALARAKTAQPVTMATK